MTAVFVTGARGFIGSRVAAHLAGSGVRVVTDAATTERLAGRADLSLAVMRAASEGVAIDAIVHAAGSGTVAQVAADPSAALPANLAAALVALEFARLHAPQAAVMLLSSAAVYGEAGAVAQAEGDAVEPVSLYGVVKLQAEGLARHYALRHGLDTTALRLFSVYGPGLRKQLLWDAMNKFRSGPAEFFGTGQERRDWVHIDDVCRLIQAWLGRQAGPGFQVFNCGFGAAASTAEVLGALAGHVGVPAPRFNGQPRPGDPQHLVANCAKAARELGWAAQTPWQRGVAEYALWFRSAVSAAPSPGAAS